MLQRITRLRKLAWLGHLHDLLTASETLIPSRYNLVTGMVQYQLWRRYLQTNVIFNNHSNAVTFFFFLYTDLRNPCYRLGGHDLLNEKLL